MTDQGAAVVWAADYLPFGTADVSVGSVDNNLRFAGQYFDQETGLHYNYHRYYDPKLGRYLRSDPIGFDGGINLYAYVLNNPLNWVDPLGLEIGDPPSPYPPGHNPDTWVPDGNGGYTDPDGSKWTPHPEDKGHWPHWDEQPPKGKKKRHPPKSKKPWPGQKKPPYGDQSPTDPNKEICGETCKQVFVGIGTAGTAIFIWVCTGGPFSPVFN
jgi:RHS repeat-associated protein